METGTYEFPSSVRCGAGFGMAQMGFLGELPTVHRARGQLVLRHKEHFNCDGR